MRETLKRHWPEYLFEATGLAFFMIFAGGLTTLLEHPDSPVHQALPAKMVRHLLLGLVMGAYIALVIYSPWGRRSGAHINPAATIAFWRLGKIRATDAIFYIIAQFAAALLTARLMLFAIGGAFAHPDVKYGATLPGAAGVLGAFVAEFAISFLLLFALLVATNSMRWKKFDGLFGGVLIALYLTFEVPLSGMSLNPARTFGSAVTAQRFDGLWVYFVAPTVAMWLAAELYLRFPLFRDTDAPPVPVENAPE